MMNGPFVCPHCGSKYLVMGYYVEENEPCFLRCRNCGFTENFPRFLEEIPSTNPREYIFAIPASYYG